MKVQVCPMDDLPCYNNSQPEEEEEDEESSNGNEAEEEDDGSNQSQSCDDLDKGVKELRNRHFKKAKEPIDDDRLANFTGFGLLEETVEAEVSHSAGGSIEAMEKEPETVEDEALHSSVGSIKAMEKEPETVEHEASHSTVESIKAMEKEPASHSTVGSMEAMEKEHETVFIDRLANFSGFGLEESDEEEVLYSRVGSTEAMEKESWRRRKPISSTTEVEVIDLMTPSPSCKVGSSMKRRRVSEFIDLTMSPNFIEL